MSKRSEPGAESGDGARRARRVGLIGGTIGGLAAGAAVAVAVGRYAVSRPDTSRPDTSRPDTSRPDTSGRADKSRPDRSRPVRTGVGRTGAVATGPASWVRSGAAALAGAGSGAPAGVNPAAPAGPAAGATPRSLPSGTAGATVGSTAATPPGAGNSRGERFGHLPADREYTVTADDGVPLHVEEVGPADAQLTVVFAHGWTLNLGSWHYQRLGLGDMTKPKLRMVFYDQRGHGKSGQPPRESCTVDQLGRDLSAVLDAAVGERSVALVGHSLGGMGIMALAEQQPKRFERQVVGVALLSTAADALMSTARFGLPRPLRTRGLPAVVRALRATPAATEKARRLGSDLVWLAVRRLAFGSRPVNSELADFVDAMIAATPIEVIADFYPALAGHDKVAALPGLRHTEVLVLCGTADRLTPAQHSRAIAAVLPDATSVLLEGVGHMAMMERPALVNLHLRAFLHRAARRAGGRRRPTSSTRRDANPT